MAFEDTETALAVVAASLDAVAPTPCEPRRRKTAGAFPLICNGSSRSSTSRTRHAAAAVVLCTSSATTSPSGSTWCPQPFVSWSPAALAMVAVNARRPPCRRRHLRISFDAFKISVADRRKASFHPKIYLGESANQIRRLVGSANLTAGAMSSNDEISLEIAVESNTELAIALKTVLGGCRIDGELQYFDDLALSQYHLSTKKPNAYGVDLRKSLKLSQVPIGLQIMDSYHKQYLSDIGERQALSARRADRLEALKIQKKIAKLSRIVKLSRLDRKASEDGLSNLLSSKGAYRHLWRSGDIHRRGSEALKHPRKTIEIFAEGAKVAKVAPSWAMRDSEGLR